MRVRDAQLVIKQINNEMLAALYRSDAQKFKLTSAKKKEEKFAVFFPSFPYKANDRSGYDFTWYQ